MHPSFRTRLAAVAVCSVFLGGCSADQTVPSAPVDRPSLEVVSPARLAGALSRPLPLAVDVVASQTIGPEGGSFGIPAVGLRVIVPPKAVSTPTNFSVRALRGALVAYDFAPHGATFNVPLEVRQDLRTTTWYTLPSLATLEAGYFSSLNQVDFVNREALIDEFLPVTADLHGAKVFKFQVRHFSGYLLSTGRR